MSVEHRVSNMSQMSISSQLSKNNSVRYHARSETPSHNQHSATPTPRESIVFNRGDEKPIAKILLSLNHSFKQSQSKDKEELLNNDEYDDGGGHVSDQIECEDECQKLVEKNHHNLESKSNSSQNESLKSTRNVTPNENSLQTLTTQTTLTESSPILSHARKSNGDIKNSMSTSDNLHSKNETLIKSKMDAFNSQIGSTVRSNNESYSNAIKNLITDTTPTENTNGTIVKVQNSPHAIEAKTKDKDEEKKNDTNENLVVANYEEFVEFEKNKKKHRHKSNNKSSENLGNKNEFSANETQATASSTNVAHTIVKALEKNNEKINNAIQANGSLNQFSLSSNNGITAKKDSKSSISITNSVSRKCTKCCTII